jgi:hypothetical protein
MGRSDEFNAVYRGLHFGANPFEPENPEAVVSRLKTRSEGDLKNPNVAQWPIFGQHWSTDPEISRQFALRQGNTRDAYREGLGQTRDRWGVVLEARSPQAARPAILDGHGESEVWPPRRDDISEVLAHVHVRKPGMKKFRDETRVATHVVPPDVWRKA